MVKNCWHRQGRVRGARERFILLLLGRGLEGRGTNVFIAAVIAAVIAANGAGAGAGAGGGRRTTGW